MTDTAANADALDAAPVPTRGRAPTPIDQALVERIVEAALLAANQPLTVAQLNGLFPLDEPAPEGSVARALESLREACAGRGVELVEVASGWRYQVQADVHAWVARLWTERQTKYSRATLETLALIAYRQPITRGEIEQVRGVAVNSNIIRALEERDWIRVVGHRDVPGKPELLATTKGFLDYFGLKRLDELPPLSELKDLGELEPQLAFDGGSPPAAAGSGEDDAAGALPVGDVAMPVDPAADGTGAAHDDDDDHDDGSQDDGIDRRVDDAASSPPAATHAGDDADDHDHHHADSDDAPAADAGHTPNEDDDADPASSERRH